MFNRLAFFALNIKLIAIIYALILFFNISSDVRFMKVSKKKCVGHRLGEGGMVSQPPTNYPRILLATIVQSLPTSLIHLICRAVQALFPSLLSVNTSQLTPPPWHKEF